MTKVHFHASVQGFRGKIGNLIYRQLPDGSTVVSEAPWPQDRRQKRSPAQKEHNSRFQEAVHYARAAARDQALYAELAALTPMWTAYNHALHDWFHPPQIGCLAQANEHILVDASDDVCVTRVRVTVLDGEGRVLEAGEALRAEDGWWVFPSQAQGKTVIAEAWDLPENMAKLVLDL
jgi:hypothetical protein